MESRDGSVLLPFRFRPEGERADFPYGLRNFLHDDRKVVRRFESSDAPDSDVGAEMSRIEEFELVSKC